MKKIFIFILLVLILSSCQKKEQPMTQGQPKAGLIQTQGDIARLQEAVKAEPKNVRAWIELGNIMMDTSRFAEAIEAYQKVLDLDPKNVDVRVDMGTCYRNIGKPDIAAKEYRKALEINPNHLNGHKNLAIVLSQDLKDRLQAIKEFEKYLSLVPNAPDAAQIKQEIQRLRGAK